MWPLGSRHASKSAGEPVFETHGEGQTKSKSVAAKMDPGLSKKKTKTIETHGEGQTKSKSVAAKMDPGLSKKKQKQYEINKNQQTQSLTHSLWTNFKAWNSTNTRRTSLLHLLLSTRPL